MRAASILCLAALPLLSACGMVPMPDVQSATGGLNPAGTPEAPGAPDPNAPEEKTNDSADKAEPTGPTMVSVSLKNNCKETVKIFFGEKPKFGSGTYSTLSSNTRTSKQMEEGDMVWIVDDSQNGVASYTASPSKKDAEIDESCTSFK